MKWSILYVFEHKQLRNYNQPNETSQVQFLVVPKEVQCSNLMVLEWTWKEVTLCLKRFCDFFLVLQKAGTRDMWMSVLKIERPDFFHLTNFYIYEK